MMRIRHAALVAMGLLGALIAGPVVAANVVTSCGPATGQGSAPADYRAYCWFDLAGYNVADASDGNGQNFAVNLPGGATMSFNLRASSTGLTASPVPTWPGAAFGNDAFIGVPGRPVLYQNVNGASVTLSFTGINLAANGSANLPFAFIAADGESTNGAESLALTTNGSPWTLDATIANDGGTLYPVLTGVGTTTVTETGTAGTVGSYVFASAGTPSTVTARIVGGGLQGAVFGVKFPSADLSIDKSHSGNFSVGNNGRYDIVVRNNGASTVTGTITVTDVLPTGLGYVSASGAGWSCSAAGQTVTCTNSATSLGNGASLPTLALTVAVDGSGGASVDNTASVTNPIVDPNPGNNSDTDPTAILGGSQLPASGNKILYVYADGTMSRTPQSSDDSTTINEGTSMDFTLGAVQKPLTITAGSTIGVSLALHRNGQNGGSRSVYVELYKNGTTLIGTSGTQSFDNDSPATPVSFTITTPSNGNASLATSDTLVLRVVNDSNGNRSIHFHQYENNNIRSTVSFDTTTVINVDSVDTYSAVFPTPVPQTSFAAGDAVYVRAVISDPFGAFDVSGADITLVNPDGTVQVPAAAAMTEIPAAATAASKTFQYSYTLPAGAKAGNWIASVTGKEGTEGTVTHTGTAIFRVNGPPLTIVKSALPYSDPVNGTTNPKAIPGALVTYQIIVASPAGTQVDADSVVITDPIPVNTVLFVSDLPDQPGTSPVIFNANGSTLTFNYASLADLADDVAFSSDNGATWTYVPVPDANGVDSAVTDIRLNPKGTFLPNSNVQMGFRVRVE